MIKNNSNHGMLAVAAILVAVILIISGVFAYNFYTKEEKNNKEPVKKIDDRISPLENQAFVLEVLRIRHRGLYDILTSAMDSWKIFSKPWKNVPSFYYVADLDGLVYSSKDYGVAAFESHNEYLLTGWDTMFQENKVVRDTKVGDEQVEEKETATITLSILERVPVKLGLFKKGTEDIVRDSIEVMYNYRTGRWSGDDNFKDYDGYGHYVGNTFEFWFNIYQMDNDHDYIPYWVEVNVLGTDPRVDNSQVDNEGDPDGDGIPTSWEWRWGYDPNVWDDHRHLDPDLDGLENIEEYQTARWLSDPFHQDIYCEIDYMAANGPLDPDHHFWEEGQQAITELYCQHNINIYFDQGWPDTPPNGGGEVLPHTYGITQDSGSILPYYNHHFPDERKGIFRYMLISHDGGFNHPAKGNVYDCIDIGWSLWTPGKSVESIKGYAIHMLLYKLPPVPVSKRFTSTIDLFHELGHSNGLHPWVFEGNDNYSCYSNDKVDYNRFWNTYGANYMSVMNYGVNYIMNHHKFDYSNGENDPLYDFNDWGNIFVADFQYDSVQVEEIFFEPPRFEDVVWGESEFEVTSYTYNADLTAQWEKTIGDWSPVDPIPVKWAVFKLTDKLKYPNYSEIKIYVEPDTNPYVHWCEYAEGKLDSSGKIQIYNQQEIIHDVLTLILK